MGNNGYNSNYGGGGSRDSRNAGQNGRQYYRQESYDGRQGSQDSRKRFAVHISEEDYENEMSYGGRRGGKDTRLAEQRRGERQMARNDVPISRTRVITSRSGERYEIPEESSLPVKLMRKKHKNQQSRGCAISIAYSTLVVAISGLLAFFCVVGINDMFGLVKDDIPTDIYIPNTGTSLSSVTKILDDNNVVDFPFFFKQYAQITNEKEFRSGAFTVNRNWDYNRIITKLTQSPKIKADGTIDIVIPEGKNVQQIYEICKGETFSTDNFYEVLNTRPWKHTFYPNIPAYKDTVVSGTDKISWGYQDRYKYRVNKLEGYLFPATYTCYPNEGTVQTINRMLNAFDNNVLKNSSVNFDAGLADLNNRYSKSFMGDDNSETHSYTMDDVITIASIIEREAQTPEDMKKVASVFYNRMNNPSKDGTGGKLQSDATKWYPYSTERDFAKAYISQYKKAEATFSDYSALISRYAKTEKDATIISDKAVVQKNEYLLYLDEYKRIVNYYETEWKASEYVTEADKTEKESVYQNIGSEITADGKSEDYLTTLEELRGMMAAEDMDAFKSNLREAFINADANGKKSALERAEYWVQKMYEKLLDEDGQAEVVSRLEESVLFREKAQELSTAESEYVANNRYNTLNYKGLPPGPICCPGLNAIKAALYPEKTSYYFFLSDNDGNFHFCESYSTFQSLSNQYL